MALLTIAKLNIPLMDPRKKMFLIAVGRGFRLHFVSGEKDAR